MKTIEKDEIFENVRAFLGTKGIQLSEGSYSQTIQKSCRILADVINMGQQGIDRAKTGLDKKLDQVRQAIHEKTAPKETAKSASEATAATPGNDTVGNGGASSREAARSKRPGKIYPKGKATRFRGKTAKKPKTPPST